MGSQKIPRAGSTPDRCRRHCHRRHHAFSQIRDIAVISSFGRNNRTTICGHTGEKGRVIIGPALSLGFDNIVLDSWLFEIRQFKIREIRL